MTSNFLIRPAQRADLESLCELLTVLFTQEAEFSPRHAVQRRGLELIIACPSLGQLFVAERNGTPVGMVSLLFTISSALGKRVALLEDLVVSPAYRRQGLGRALLQTALQFAKQEQYGRVTLLTDSDNQVAQRLYVEQGFARSSMVVFRQLLAESE